MLARIPTTACKSGLVFFTINYSGNEHCYPIKPTTIFVNTDVLRLLLGVHGGAADMTVDSATITSQNSA